MVTLSKTEAFGLDDFKNVVFNQSDLKICPQSLQRLSETREFIDYLLDKKAKVYGLTTGFADLRSKTIDPLQAAELSCNLLKSHDAGIGSSLPFEVVLGAMLVRASSLAKGHSGFQPQSLETLVQMINHRIVPLVPKTGSLGASGDLAFLARLGRAMCGHNVQVWCGGTITDAKDALQKAKIAPFVPLAKEGLAITNGTSFMISMIAIAFLQEIHEIENILAMQGLFFNAIGSVDAAFNQSIQNVRKQKGQKLVSEILFRHFDFSPFIDFEGVQDDYCIRCLPQIFGPKIELILEQYPKIERELDAVTDNPLFFKEEEISPDIFKERLIRHKNENWVVLSGGNFHGECLTTIADAICIANVKIALTLERQITYMLNPFRNKNKLPCYLIADSLKAGLISGYMITQYTANALAQKISQLGIPTSIFNITSANESEDIVSYGASAGERLLEQLSLLKELNAIYLTVATQAYSFSRHRYLAQKKNIPPELLAEKIFIKVQDFSGQDYPITSEESFEKRYHLAGELLATENLRSLIGYPLQSLLTKESVDDKSFEITKLVKMRETSQQSINNATI